MEQQCDGEGLRARRARDCGVPKGVHWGSSRWDSNATERGSELDVSWAAACRRVFFGGVAVGTAMRRRGAPNERAPNSTCHGLRRDGEGRRRERAITPPTDCDIRHRQTAIYATDRLRFTPTTTTHTHRCRTARELILASLGHREVEEKTRDRGREGGRYLFYGP